MGQRSPSRGAVCPGVGEVPVTAETALLAATALESGEGFHADLADQLIAATAIVARRRLVTSDHKILHWATGRTEPTCLDARTAIAKWIADECQYGYRSIV